MRLPPAAVVEQLASGSLRVTTSTEPEFTIDISAPEGVAGASAIEMLSSFVPTYFTESEVTYLIGVESFDVMPGGLEAASVLYDQAAEGFNADGALILVTRRDGTALLLDIYYDGPAPSADISDPIWHDLGDFAFSALWGVS